MPVSPSTDNTTARELRSEGDREYSLLVWCLLSFAILISSGPARLLSSATLFPSGQATVLHPEHTWYTPVARIGILNSGSAFPWMVVAMLSAIVIGFIAQYASRRAGVWIGFLAVFALSWGFRELHIIPALLMMGFAVPAGRRTAERSYSKYVCYNILIFGVAIATTLEYGISLLFWLCLALSQLSWTWKDQRTRVTGIVLAGVFVVLWLGCLHSGFRAVLFRPINWWGISAYPGMLDSLAPSLSWDGVSAEHMLLLAVIGSCWYQSSRSWSMLRESLVVLVIFTALGALCSYYLWLSTIAVLLGCRHESPTRSSKRIHGLVIVGVLLFAVVRQAGPGTGAREYLLSGTVPARRIDPAEWGLTGPVLLLDLDRTPEWQMLGRGEKFRLVLDDRWEVSGGHYPEYAALVRDLREMRTLVYFRTDLRFGGSRHQLEQWNPMLVVVDSGDLEAIRNLSLSPHWNLMGIDSQITIFGQAENEATLPQIRKTGDHLLTLEWPNDASQTVQQNVIAASTPDEFCRVASVLVAIRLPYASLRLLPLRNSVQGQKIEAWCYLELAHRTLRNTGRHSLIDNFRAITLMRELSERDQWSPTEVARLTRAVQGLGLPGLAEDIFPEVGIEEEPELTLPVQLIPEDEASPSGSGNVERVFREQLLRGQAKAAEVSLRRLPDDLKAFYEAILTSMDQSPENLAKKLYRVSETQKLPQRLRVETLYYLGCVAIEFGDRDVAINALTQSEQLDPQSNWSPLRMLYLQQLQRP